VKKVYIINQYYSPFFAATGQLLKELAEYLTEKNHNIEVITGTNGTKKLQKKESINNVVVHRLKNSKDGVNIKTKFLSYLTFYWKLFWFLLFKTERNSIILTLSSPPLISFIPIMLKNIKKYKLIYNIQDLYPDILERIDKKNKNKFFYIISKKISQKIINGADIIVVIGSCMEKTLKEEYQVNENKLTVIENWALKEIEEYKNEKVLNDNNHFKILYSGNMGRGHEHETILKCIEKLKNDDLQNIFFEFVGGGYNYNLLKSKVGKYEFVQFKSYVEKEKLPEIISSADVCLVIGSKELEGIIVPSKFYGIVAAGKPVIYISSGNDTISEHIRKGHLGFHISNGDYEKLYELIKYLSENKSYLQELEKNAKKYYYENLRRILSLEKYEKLFKELEEPK